MLYQIVPASAVCLSVIDQLAHAIKLVIAREDHRLFRNLLNSFVGEDAFLFDLQMHEPSEDVQKTVTLQNLAPEISRSIPAVHSWRITGMSLITKIERQEVSLITAQTRGHEYLILVDGKMDQR